MDGLLYLSGVYWLSSIDLVHNNLAIRLLAVFVGLEKPTNQMFGHGGRFDGVLRLSVHDYRGEPQRDRHRSVLLQQSDDQFAPLALAIKGNYNRLGSIDGIDEDANTRLILRFFLESLRSGEFTVDEEYLRENSCFPIRSIETLLQGFERNMNDGEGRAVLNGRSVGFALIAWAVWETIAGAARPPSQLRPCSSAYSKRPQSDPGSILARWKRCLGISANWQQSIRS